MNSPARHLFGLFACLALWSLVSGCSPEARKQRHLAKANAYFSEGRWDAAEIELMNVLQYEAFNYEAVSKLGAIYFDQSRLGRVFPFLMKSRELKPDDLDSRSRLAMFLLSVGRTKDAREEALYVLDRRPTDLETPLVLAEAAMTTADVVAATERLARLPEPARASATVLVARGMLELRQRRVAEARQLFEDALRADPRYAPAHIGIANVHWAQGDVDLTEAAFERAANFAPARSPRRLQYPKFCIQNQKMDRAREFLTELTTKTPDYLAAWVLLADLLAAEKRYDESLVAIQKVLARDYAHPEAMLLSSRVRLAKGESQKALLEMERAVNIYPQSAQLNHQLALAYIANQDLAKASAAAAQAVALAPRYVEAVMLHAEITLRLGHYSTAIPLLRQLVQQQPAFIPAHLLLAQGLRAQGSLDDALETYRRLDQAQPKDPQLQLLMGSVLVQQSKLKEARELFERALEFSANFLPAIEQLVNLDISEKAFDPARARIEPLVRHAPDSAPLYLLLAKVQLAEQNNLGAESSLLRSAELQPDLPLTYFLLAKIYLGTQQPDKAIAHLAAAAEKDPKDVQSRMLIGILHDQQKHYDLAQRSYEEVLAINPRFSAALNNLAYLHSERLDDLDKAFGYAQKARELQPGEPHIADTLGWILHRRGQYMWALSMLTESAALLRTSPDVWLHLGLTHYMLGQESAARTAFDKALEIDPAFPGVPSIRAALAVLDCDPSTASPTAVALLKSLQDTDPMAAIKTAQILERDGSFQEAIAAYDRALRLSPDNIGAALGLLKILTAQNEFERALTIAKATRKLAPNDIDVAISAGRLAYAAGDEAWSTSLLQEAVRARPAQADLQFDLARSFYATGEVEGALAAANRCLKLDPPADLRTLVQRFIRTVDAVANPAHGAISESEVEAWLRAEPKNVPSLMAQASLAVMKNDRQAARVAYAKALAIHRQFTPAMRGLVLLDAENPNVSPETVELATKLRIAAPGDTDITRALGIMQCQQGNYARAAALLLETCRLTPRDSTGHYFLGLAQLRLKDQAAGIRSLKHALELGLPDARVVEAQKLIAGD